MTSLIICLLKYFTIHLSWLSFHIIWNDSICINELKFVLNSRHLLSYTNAAVDKSKYSTHSLSPIKKSGPKNLYTNNPYVIELTDEATYDRFVDASATNNFVIVVYYGKYLYNYTVILICSSLFLL